MASAPPSSASPLGDLSRWKGKVGLVTGASSGIGTALAEALGRAGMRVAIAARRGDRLEAQAQALRALGIDVLPVPTDLRKESDIEALFDTLRARWHGVDVLINNAGLGYKKPALQVSAEEWRETLDVNVVAVSLCIREALQQMAGREDAAIITVSSIAAHMPMGRRGVVAYGASKYAVRSLMEGLREELVDSGNPVKFSTIAPGLTATEFHQKAEPGQGGKGFYGDYRPLDPEDVAQAALYILSTPAHVQVNEIVLRPVGQPH